MKTRHYQSYSSDYPDRYINTYTPAPKYQSYCPVSFTKRGFRQFARVNQLLGKSFIRAFVLYREVAAYIMAHEADGYHLDTICLDVRYDENVYLLLMKCHGEWLITDVGLIGGESKRGHEGTKGGTCWTPVFVWQRITHGLRIILRQILCGWKRVAMTTATPLSTIPAQP